MGPRLGSRGKLFEKLCIGVALEASMGPRLGSRGKESEIDAAMEEELLQWGRDLEVAERSPSQLLF